MIVLNSGSLKLAFVITGTYILIKRSVINYSYFLNFEPLSFFKRRGYLEVREKNLDFSWLTNL